MVIQFAIVIAGAIACFIIGAIWYGALFNRQYAQLISHSKNVDNSSSPSKPVLLMEFLRCLVLAAAVAYLNYRLGTADLTSSLALAVVIWAGFQLTGLIGSVLHESYPLKLYAIHMGDALAKIVASSVIYTTLMGRFG